MKKKKRMKTESNDGTVNIGKNETHFSSTWTPSSISTDLCFVRAGYQPEPYNPEAPKYKYPDMDEVNRESGENNVQYQPQSRSSLVSVPTIPDENEGQCLEKVNRCVTLIGIIC